jgi:hypothetical protein
VGENIQRTAKTPDGRTLAIEEAGDPHGRPVLVHNGTPNSRHLYAPHATDAAGRGLRLIGYGCSRFIIPNDGGACPALPARPDREGQQGRRPGGTGPTPHSAPGPGRR